MINSAKKIFITSYLAYASYYLVRLSLSMTIPAISKELGYSRLMLGLISGAFSISYAIGQFINGQLADSFGARKLISLGLATSAIISIAFGYSEAFPILLLLWGLNGYFQSMGWPSVVKMIGEWFRRESSGKVGCFFGSCFLVGNMISWIILGWITANMGWRASFLIPPIPLIPLALIIYLNLEERRVSHKIRSLKNEAIRMSHRFWRIMFSKRIIIIAATYILLQFIRSGLSTWAPSYIFEVYGVSPNMVGWGAAAIPLGGVVGSAIAGWLSDRLGRSRRLHWMMIMVIFLSFVISALYGSVSYGLYLAVVLLFLSGLMLYAPHVVRATAVPIDLEKKYGAAGVAGFIDGLGYIGIMFADPFIGWLVDVYGWNGAVTFWFLSSIGSALLLSTLILESREE